MTVLWLMTQEESCHWLVWLPVDCVIDLDNILRANWHAGVRRSSDSSWLSGANIHTFPVFYPSAGPPISMCWHRANGTNVLESQAALDSEQGLAVCLCRQSERPLFVIYTDCEALHSVCWLYDAPFIQCCGCKHTLRWSQDQFKTSLHCLNENTWNQSFIKGQVW